MTKLDDLAYCHRCNAKTRWLPLRSRVRCEGCDQVFPCKNDCRHLDCADARKEHRRALEKAAG